MPEINIVFKRQSKYMVYLLAVFVLGWGFTNYQTVFGGLLLGTSLSLYNLWLVNQKMKKFDQAITEGGKVKSLGTMTRFASAGLAVIIALKYPEYFHLISVVLGLMTAYLVIIIDFFIHLKRQ
ncbi:ATP synthase subunit I [Peribacillus loiseleuriae]|uniref:ATP synthase I n=1 Tax=Peribacillus loiseleuriae TaxID=1679170 RepID=A0A0K9GZC9_9BACI|nr:ATP synthase subunit I [Peribacillus loiseleuriae]KMY51960.1 ATP synthase I [Peribacillus loiseleuriae]